MDRLPEVQDLDRRVDTIQVGKGHISLAVQALALRAVQKSS